ncbi:Cytoplasmic protein, partial [Monkeypox virus]
RLQEQEQPRPRT